MDGREKKGNWWGGIRERIGWEGEERKLVGEVREGLDGREERGNWWEK